jgi:Ca-activated chloride channel family protein
MRTFVFWLVALGAAAQELPPLAIKVDVRLVNVAFVVRDTAGRLYGDLTKDDIEIFEDGVRQEVKFFGRSNDLPLRLGLVADVSGSQERFIKRHHRDVERFVHDAVTPRDRALLICFGNHIRVVSDFSSSAAELMDGLESFEKHRARFPELEPDDTREAGTALFDAMYLTAMQKMRPIPGARKALILFSDGEDNSSAHDLMDAIEAAQIADSLIYTVRYTESEHGRLTARNRYGIREMDRLAAETGGAAFDASKGDVAGLLRQVADELPSMYDVGYVSTNHARDETFRKVEIRLKREGLTVRTKPGYFAR